MRYRNRTAPLLQVLNRPGGGVVGPLCNHCTTKDCSHAIEPGQVSILGVTRNWRLIVKGNEYHIVVTCDGFSSNRKSEKNNGKNNV